MKAPSTRVVIAAARNKLPTRPSIIPAVPFTPFLLTVEEQPDRMMDSKPSPYRPKDAHWSAAAWKLKWGDP